MIKRYASAVVLLMMLLPSALRADEGMWMAWMVDSVLEGRMKEKGLTIDAKIIYDESRLSISDAVVALDFSCTGSMISKDGLMITNHHCAYSDICALSTPEHNYLDEGFWAFYRQEEIPIKERSVYFLKKVIDITDDYRAVEAEYRAKGEPAGSRKITAMVEKKFKAQYGENVSCDCMWRGEKYYLAVYQVYSDIRLVAAPPASVAAFGGDPDNWEWPQHKGDFAIYRIYTAPDGSPAEYSPDNIPLHPERILPISTKGVSTGDFTMVLGYPGTTHRYWSSFAVERASYCENPPVTELRGRQMEIIKKWMNIDDEVRMKYSDYYFSLSNVQEYKAGESLCYRRFGVPDIKRESEKELQSWIESDPQRITKYGSLLADMGAAYEHSNDMERQKTYYREAISHGSRLIYLAHRINLLETRRAGQKNTPPEPVVATDNPRYVSMSQEVWDQIDLRVEREILEASLKSFFKNVDPKMWGDYMLEAYRIYGGDVRDMVDHIWAGSYITDQDRFWAFSGEPHYIDDFHTDPLVMLLFSSQMSEFSREVAVAEGETSCTAYDKLYTYALYEMRLDKGIPQYPDANSTMRLSYGTVGPLEPWDAVWCADFSTAAGILQKRSATDYDFKVLDRTASLLENEDWGPYAASDGRLHVNFLTDNDITGGNSGSPVLNGDGELVGLAFDGNKESLSGDTYCHPDYNKCVCVDIRYVLWILDRYAGAQNLLQELEII